MMLNCKLIFLLFIHLILGILIGQFLTTRGLVHKTTDYILSAEVRKPLKENTRNLTSNVHVLNLSEPIDEKFKCMQTKTLLTYLNTHVCLHESSKDVYVSGSFRGTSSIWEEDGVVRTLHLLLRNPHLDFIDIGANIGTYTMYAAALGRFVLAIDCFAPNLQRIQRAVQLSNVANRVVLIQNAIFSRSGEYLRISNNAINVGGQEIDVNTKQLRNLTRTDDPYLVKTIRFDELLPMLIARGVRGAIMKIDIEGSESFVVEGGSQIFDSLDIPYIQMEWLNVRHHPDRVKLLLDFFSKRNYEPKTFSCQLLTQAQLATWPNDFCWVKRNVPNLC